MVYHAPVPRTGSSSGQRNWINADGRKFGISYIQRLRLGGTLLTTMGEPPIVDGRVEGGKITFEVVMSGMGGERRMKYEGRLAGGELQLAPVMRAGGIGPPPGGPGDPASPAAAAAWGRSSPAAASVRR